MGERSKGASTLIARAILVASLLLCAGGPQAYSGPGQASGAQFEVNSTITYARSHPRVAMNSAGGFVVVWESYNGSNGWNIYARCYKANGLPLTSDSVVNVGTGGNHRFPAVAMNAGGQFLVAWESFPVGQVSGHQVLARSFNSSCTAQVNTDLLMTGSGSNQSQTRPAVGIDSSGAAVVAWEENDGSGNGQIYAETVTSTGTAGTSFSVYKPASGTPIKPSVGKDAQQNIYVAWVDETSTKILAKGFTGGTSGAGTAVAIVPGQTPATPVQLNTLSGNGNTVDAPAIAVSPNASLAAANVDFVASWEYYVSGSPTGVQRIMDRVEQGSAGLKPAAESAASTNITNYTWAPAMAMSYQGNQDWWLTWQDFDSSGVGILAIDNLDQLLNFLVNTYTTGPQHSPSVALDFNGDAVMVWASLDEVGTEEGVFAQQYIGGPPAPTTLVAYAGVDSVALEWSPSSGASSYVIYQGISPGNESAAAIVQGLDVTRYIVTGLNPDLTYYFKVAGVSNGNVGPQSGEASASPLNPVTGSQFAVGADPSGLILSPNGLFAYIANYGDNNVSAFTVDPGTGFLTPISGTPFGSGNGPSSVTVAPLGNFAYVADSSGNGVSAYTVTSGTGVLVPVPGGPYGAGTNPAAVAVDPTGQFAYVANQGSNSVSAYTINPVTGALTPVTTGGAGSCGSTPDPLNCFAAGSGPIAATVDPTGKFVYVANLSGASVSGYTLNASTGALTPIAGSPFAAGNNPQSVTVDSSAKFAYVANKFDNNISAYTINPSTGVLVPISGAPYPAGIGPSSVTIGP